MTDLVQYASASAISADKHVKRQALAVRVSGSGGKKSIIDGYIVSTARTSGGTITRVIDPPALVMYALWTKPAGLGSLAFGYSLSIGNRDTYTPRSTVSLAPVHPPGLVPVAPAYKYVAPEPAAPTDAMPRSLPGQAWVDGGVVYNVNQRRVATTLAGSSYDSLICIMGAYWGSKFVPADGYVGQFSLDADVTPKMQALYVHAKAIAVEAGESNVSVQQTISDVFRPAAYSASGSTFVAIHAQDSTPMIPKEGVPLLLVCAMSPQADKEVPMTWARALRVGGADTPKSDVYFADTAGLHVGAQVTVTSTVWDNTGWYGTKRFVLDKSTGATLSYDVISDSEVVVYAPVTTTDIGIWMARSKRTPGAGYGNLPTDTVLVTGAITRTVDLGGWTLVSTLLQGFEWVSILGPNTSPVSAAVITLSEGVLGVLACPPPASPTGYDYGEQIPVHLLEVDANTLTVVSNRGFVANTSLDLGQAMYSGFNASVVTPQVVDTSGVVVTPAVLLCSYAGDTLLSTDGGETWAVVATGVTGYPYYIGNLLHPVDIGATL